MTGDSFSGKTVVITGAAGGIGGAVCDRFLAAGANLVAADQAASDLSKLQHSADAQPDRVHLCPGDLRDRDYCEGLIEYALHTTGAVDVLVNNAGIITRGNVLDTSDEDWRRTMEINLDAVFFTCRAAIRHMKVVGAGAIVNTASTWGLYPGPDHPAYCASKAAVAALTRCLARDHAADGIRINAVCPNEVNTPMLHEGFKIRGFDSETAIEELNRSVPLGRIAEPEDIADVIVFLASDAARYVAGATLEVSGAKAVY